MAVRVPLHAHDADDGDERGGQATQATQVAFEDLWQHRAALRDLCQRIVGDAATADDVVQETYLRALRNLDSLERRPSLMPWLATVARRRSIDELRRRGYQHPVDEMPDEGTKPEYDPGEAAAVNETVLQVREALTSLTDRERDLLLRQVNQGLTLAELAEVEASSVASVRSVLSRARTKLRDALSDAGTRVLAPLGVLGGWLKRKTADLNVKVQQASPLVSGGYDRLGEVATATVAAAALAVGGVLVPAGASTSGGEAAAIETVEVSADGVSVASNGVAAAREGGEDPRATDSALSGNRDTQVEEAAPPRHRKPSFTPRGERSLPTHRLSDSSSPKSPDPPPDHGSPIVAPEAPAAEPEDTDIEDVEAGASDNAGTHLVALGDYGGDCGPRCDSLFVSNDGGATWDQPAASGLAAHSILVSAAFDADADERIYAVGSEGLLRSTNAGESFSEVPGGAGLTDRATISPAFNEGHDTIYFGVAPFRSYDASQNKVSLLNLSDIAGTEANFAFAPDYLESRLLYAGSTALTPSGLEPAVYSCVDGDCEATVVSGFEGMPEVAAYDNAVNERVVVAYSDNALFVSVGDTLDFEWVEELPLDGTISSVTRSHAGDLQVSFAGTEGASGGGIALTADAGESWTVLGSGALSGGVVDTAVTDAVMIAALNSGDRGVMCSTDHGATWARRCG